MRYTHYDELKKRWQINDDYGAVMIDELNYAVGEAIDKLAAYEDAEEDKGYILAPQEEYDGLKRKYVVLKSDSGEPVEDCFVLRPDKDKAAIVALLAYAGATDNQVLAKDIRAWISAIPAEEATQKNGVQHGKWIQKGRKIYCSKCNRGVYIGTDDEDLIQDEMRLRHFCSACGAKMDGGHDDV